jgi:hypothetical protein
MAAPGGPCLLSRLESDLERLHLGSVKERLIPEGFLTLAALRALYKSELRQL